ncbi:MAG TPA: hypothetical protein VFI61_00190 [Patescibacteria group bacterium]|nr:hypothetical protein [Patescibacteria group bacterium]
MKPLEYYYDFKFKKCSLIQDPKDNLRCYRTLIKSIVASGDVSYAVKTYKHVIRRGINLDSCHTIGHDIGRDIYLSLKENKYVKITDSMSECGYGFWHGFLSGIADKIKKGEVKNADMIILCKQILADNLNISLCYHGIGLGFVGDPPNREFWGSYRKMINDAIPHCDELTNNSDYLFECYSGVFHQTFSYMSDGYYGLKFPNTDKMFSLCTEFKNKYQKACTYMISPYMSNSFKNLPDLYKAISTKFSWTDEQTRLDIFTNVTAAIVDTGGEQELKDSLLYCFTLNVLYKDACLQGFYWSALNKDIGGDIDGVAGVARMCDQDFLNDKNKNICFDFLSIQIMRSGIKIDKIKDFCDQNRGEILCRKVDLDLKPQT